MGSGTRYDHVHKFQLLLTDPRDALPYAHRVVLKSGRSCDKLATDDVTSLPH